MKWVSNETENSRLELTPQKGPSKDVSEKSLAADTSVGSDTCILLRMQSVEQSAVDEVDRPNHGWRLDQETLCDPTDRETYELGRHNKKPLVYNDNHSNILL